MHLWAKALGKVYCSLLTKSYFSLGLYVPDVGYFRLIGLSLVIVSKPELTPDPQDNIVLALTSRLETCRLESNSTRCKSPVPEPTHTCFFVKEFVLLGNGILFIYSPLPEILYHIFHPYFQIKVI